MFKTVVFSVRNKGFTYEVWLTKKFHECGAFEHLWKVDMGGNSSLTDFS